MTEPTLPTPDATPDPAEPGSAPTPTSPPAPTFVPGAASTGGASAPPDQGARDLVSRTGLERTLFVEAGAGTGKTTQLVERISNLVLDHGVRLVHIAAITFTEAAAAELQAWCATLIADRRAHPTDDLVTHLLEVEVDGERLDDVDITAVITGFVFAGAETTKRQLTQLVIAFAEHPDSWQQLADRPDLIPNAVEEVMRYRPIVPALTRVAVDPTAHDELELAPGDRAVVVIDTANRCPATFADPDTFDVARLGADAHLTFGWGPHFCVGAGLARVEMQEALRALVTRFGAPRLDVLHPAAVPAGFSGPDELAVHFPIRTEDHR